MRARSFISVAILTCLCWTASAQEPSLEALSWLTGHWGSDDGETVVDEVWLPPRGGQMLGMHRDAKADSAFFEFLRIVDDEDGIAYLAQPLGREPTRFDLIEQSAEHVVFENPDHDFPQRIIYRLDSDGSLHARVEGTVDGELRGGDWRWTRVSDR